jgi:predicted PurR-regulated permease PerM
VLVADPIRDPMPRWLLGGLVAGAALAVLTFSPWVVLAIWLGLDAMILERPLRRWLGGRRRLSAAITVTLLILLLTPVVAILTSVLFDAIALVQDLVASDRAKAVLEKLVENGGPPRPAGAGAGVLELLLSQGDRAWAVATQIAGAAAYGTIGMLILVSGIYGVLVDGEAWYQWAEAHAVVPPATLRRFAAAFVETGRGLLFGIVGAGLLQAIVATTAFLVIGVAQPFALGLLTLLFSLIPAIGTALVWVPVAAGLALTGRVPAAIGLAVVGLLLISTADNLARPWLAKRGQLQLPAFVVMVAMFGGVELVGGWGLILGPLVVRLAKEAILIRSDAARGDVGSAA